MGKPSAVGQLTRPTQPFILTRSINEYQIVKRYIATRYIVTRYYPSALMSSSLSCNQMAATTSQWWRRLVNAYEVKAGMVYFQGKSCVIHTWALQGEVLTMGRYANRTYSTFTFYLYCSNDWCCSPVRGRWRRSGPATTCATTTPRTTSTNWADKSC